MLFVLLLFFVCLFIYLYISVLHTVCSYLNLFEFYDNNKIAKLDPCFFIIVIYVLKIQ